MIYVSTRGSKEELSGAKAIIQGLSSDRGLFVPTTIPKLPFMINDMVGKTYQEVAEAIIGAFFDDYTKEEIKKCVYGAYDEKFEKSEIAPLIKVGEEFVLELYHGKTAAFKDMALSILPYLLTTAMVKEKEEQKICILTATSGDTGKAALEGFADVPGTEIIVFYPNQGVSEVQQRQMVTQVGDNTHVYAINGNFDHAQTGVKNIFNDRAFNEGLRRKGVKLSSANSINIGRLVPQVAYYVYSYLKLIELGEIKNGDKVNVVVPTGNFGNILAAYYAREMGIPFAKFICASNENKVLTDFIRTGTYSIDRKFHLTNSPSMDILISSNLERLLFHLAGGKSETVGKLMSDLESNNEYTVEQSIKDGLKDFYGGYAEVRETNEAIGEVYEKYGYLMDTHTAVAYKVYEDYKKETKDETKTIIASTASAYKFAESVAKAIGIDEKENDFRYVESLNEKTGVSIPKELKDLEHKEILHKNVVDQGEMVKAVEESLGLEVRNYTFFNHKECEFFPCHKVSNPADFNCLFCYCPLYALGSKCGGNYSYTEQGFKDCSNCMIPHNPQKYDYIMEKYGEIAKLAAENK